MVAEKKVGNNCVPLPLGRGQRRVKSRVVVRQSDPNQIYIGVFHWL